MMILFILRNMFHGFLVLLHKFANHSLRMENVEGAGGCKSDYTVTEFAVSDPQILSSTYQGYPAKRALSAMHKHGR